MQTADPTGLELLLLKQVKDKTPVVRHFIFDDTDEKLRQEEIKVEMFKDGYAIYFVSPGRKARFASYMAFIRFIEGKMEMSVQLKTWQWNKSMYIYFALIFCVMLIYDLIAGSLLSLAICILFIPTTFILMKTEKTRFTRQLESYLADLQNHVSEMRIRIQG